MAKKRKRRQQGKTVPSAADIYSDDEGRQETWDVDKDGFYKDEIDEYHEEKMLLDTSNMEPASFSEDEQSDEEVLQLPSESDQEEEEEELEEEEDKIPSDKAWGRKKQVYYDTDYINDEGGNSSDESLAEEEEREALSLQQRMIQTLRHDDFGLDNLSNVLPEAPPTLNIKKIAKVPREISALSNDDKLLVIEEEWPEFMELYKDMESKNHSIKDLFQPLTEYSKKYPQIYSVEGMKLLNQLNTLHHLYVMNILFYLVLRAHKFSDVESHPVIARIIELRELLGGVGTPFNSEHLERIEEMVPLICEGSNKAKDKINDKDLELKRKRKVAIEEKEEPLEYYKRIKRLKEEKKKRKEVRFADEQPLDEGASDDEREDDGKRAITYTIARNKGLTPKRKKEQRNPRVKHRKRFDKALTKHRRIVRPVQKELSRYGGEKGGIKSNLTRSVKIK